MTKINEGLYLSSLQEKQRVGGKSNLGKDDFLKILMTQLQNQDPSNPMKDNEFIAQMATFSSLEQMTNMTKTMEKFVESQNQTQLIAYNGFVGKEIAWHKIEESEDGNSEPNIIEGTGVIKGVRFKEDTVEFIMDDGSTLTPGNISQINDSKNYSESSLVTASMLIGKTATWLEEDQEKSGLVISVSNKDGAIWVHLEDGSKVKSKDLTKIEA